IEVSGYSGFVKKIAVRSTRIETFDLHDVVIPNSDLIAGSVKNMTLRSSHGRLVVKIGVAYGSDLKVVKSVLIDAAKQHDMVLS
ncbi:mechanosensitive ion channel domain-containing protein, partial [Vibrio natriegens]